MESRKRSFAAAAAGFESAAVQSGMMTAPKARRVTGLLGRAGHAQATRQPNRLSMAKYALETLLYDIDQASTRFRRTRVHKSWEYSKLARTTQVESEGEKRVEAMKRALEYTDASGFMRSKQQKVMHMAFLTISYAQYFGEDIQRHLIRLLSTTGFSELRSECMVLAPRRYGKTISCSLWTGAELVTQPGHDVLIYSNNHRASKMMLLQTYRVVRILQRNPDFGGRVVGLNKNESLTYRTKDGHTNELKAYPAKPENLRGTGSTRKTGTVILEEMAYIPLELVLEIVAPTLTRKNVKLIGITTVSGADSFVGPMAEAKFPDGRSVFLTLNFELVCSECKRAGTPETCKCLVGDIPYWQSSSQHEKLEIIMKGRIETFMKEIKGFSMDQTVSAAFDAAAVRFLQTPQAVMTTSELYSPEIFVAVDPACGGKYSKFAIMSAIFIDNRMVVSRHARGVGAGGLLCESVGSLELERLAEGHAGVIEAKHLAQILLAGDVVHVVLVGQIVQHREEIHPDAIGHGTMLRQPFLVAGRHDDSLQRARRGEDAEKRNPRHDEVVLLDILAHDEIGQRLEQADVLLDPLHLLERGPLVLREAARVEPAVAVGGGAIVPVGACGVVRPLLFVAEAGPEADRDTRVRLAGADDVVAHGADVGLQCVARHDQIVAQQLRVGGRVQHHRHDVACLCVGGLGNGGLLGECDAGAVDAIGLGVIAGHWRGYSGGVVVAARDPGLRCRLRVALIFLPPRRSPASTR